MEAKLRIAPCLWFDDQAEEAARFYTSIFGNSRIVQVARYPKSGSEITGKAPGTVMTVDFEIEGQPFTALNGGPHFKFNEAVSLQVICKDQAEIDYFWEKLGEGGDPRAQQCGWLKDKFGVSWQVTPALLQDLIDNPDSPNSERAFAAMLKMKKMDIAELERAYRG
ncbi:MAG TPA: VOC family protein [Thermoanaerobaculia bacterium]|nr:VOC family protein [Thermoanaerobaculia bacterium]